ncbi:MFS transporter [Cellulomonas alba]|uniref:MFS transporter n=1 Tax=Cellulomonas alba TaxID=3053467 RepID=A0ABT7SG75_9CELL|nr:MFS transporter [Cellulomonas alba]MDM7855186.1 MFS transporter [Cellulomonas alba]
MLQPYRGVLTRPGTLAFSAAALVARLPISMIGIGIVLAVSSLYGSYGLAGRVSAVYLVAQAVCAPLLGRWVDRRGQARAMRPTLAVFAVALVGLVAAAQAHADPLVLDVAAAVTGATLVPFGSLVRARWSHALGDDAHAMHTAYSLESALDEVVFVVGPVAATLLATSVSPTAGLVVPLVAAIAGGLWFLQQRATEPPAAAPGTVRAGGSVMRNPGMVVLAVVFVAMGAIFGATDVSTVAFADEAGHKGLAGPLLAVFAAGSLVAGLAYGSRQWHRPLHLRFAVGMVGLAVGSSLLVLAQTLWMLVPIMFVAGLAIAPTLINGNGLVQQLVPAERLTEGLTWVTTALGVGVSVGSSVAGQRVDADGAHGGYLVVVGAGAFALVATVAAYRTLRAPTPGARAAAGPGACEDESPSASAGAAVAAVEVSRVAEPRDR